MSSLRSSITLSPVLFARRSLSLITAGIVPEPGSDIPIVSVKQFIELAVYIPLQEPQVGQAVEAQLSRFSRLILPAKYFPEYSNISDSPIRFEVSVLLPGNIGPPETKMHGRLRRQAASSIPGTILSQFGINTIASSGCAVSITSIESAISSREQRLYFMPLWFIAIPSQTPIVLNSNGTPPAFLIPALT